MHVAVLWSLLLGLGSIAEAQTPARVDGIVLDDETGVPVSKAVVLLDTGYVPEFRRYGAVTDRDGRFSVEDVKPSTYVIRVERAGYCSFPAIPLSIAEGDHVDGITLKITRQGIIAGEVVNLAGVSPWLAPMRLWQMTFAHGYRTAEPLKPAIPEPDGTFVFGGIVPGRYFLEKPSLSMADAVVFDVAAGREIRTVPIRRQPAAPYRISGVARNPSPEGKIVDGTVSLEGKEPSGSWVSLEKRLRLNPQKGEFTFNALPAGDYRIRGQITVRSGRSDRTYLGAKELRVEGRSTTGVSLEFTPIAIITGTVSERAGLPPRSQPLFVGLTGIDPDTSRVSSAQTLPKTTFRLEVAPGRYRATGWNAGVQVRSVDSVRFNGREMVPDVVLNIAAEGGKLEVVFGGGREIAGTVRDAAGRSIAGARVAAWRDGGGWIVSETYADGMGRFAIQGAPRVAVYVAAAECMSADIWRVPTVRTALQRLASKVPAQDRLDARLELRAIPRTVIEAEVAKIR